MSLSAVSLFSNCGAGDVGFREAGFEFAVMAELEQRRLDVALLNHEGAVGVVGDLRETWGDVVEQYRSKFGDAPPDLLSACPPCQGMSSARSGMGGLDDPKAGSSDSRNLLVTVISQVAHALKPRVIVVENVQAFLSRRVFHPQDKNAVSAAQLLIGALSKDYRAFPIAADLSLYGVPQARKRAFITFVRRDEAFLLRLVGMKTTPYPQPAAGPRVNVVDALASFGLPSLDASSASAATDPVRGGMHSVPVWSPERYAMVAAIGIDSSAWANSGCSSCGRLSPEPTDATCGGCGSPLLRPVILEKGAYRLVKGFRTSYSRMKSSEPASTVTTASGHLGSDLTIHPTENRVLSPLECALLQTFPPDFNWGTSLKKYGSTFVREMIGEAVPPMFTRLHGEVLAGLLSGNDDRLLGTQSAESSDSKRAHAVLVRVAQADHRPLVGLD